MKRETGNNHPGVNKGVSIQLKLGGHSFSADTLPAVGGDGIVLCELLTPRTMLVPREEFDTAVAGILLDAAGMPCRDDETAVWSDPEGAAVAVMAFDTTIVDALRKHFGARLRFTTPLLFTCVCAPPAVWLCRNDELLYIKVYNGGLRFAEVVTVQTEADLLYHIELLDREFKLAEYEVCLAGEIEKTTCKALRRYFRTVGNNSGNKGKSCG